MVAQTSKQDLPVQLGAKPNRRLNVPLVPGTTFWTVLRNTEGNWDAGAAIELRFDDGTTWHATIVGTDATFEELPVEVDRVIENLVETAGLYYLLGGHVIPWALGNVVVDES